MCRVHVSFLDQTRAAFSSFSFAVVAFYRSGSHGAVMLIFFLLLPSGFFGDLPIPIASLRVSFLWSSFKLNA